MGLGEDLGVEDSMASALWRWRELCDVLRIHGDIDGSDVSGVSIDSRTLAPGSLFIALDGSSGPLLTAGKGTGHDGHDFVAHAEERGARAAMVHRELEAGIPLLRVKDTREGLWQLGAAARRRCKGVVFAVTGSAGKTTAKSMLAEVTGGFAAAGSLNNVWGVPLSLALTPRGAVSGVYEIGMNAPAEIAPLSRLVQPHVALVLNALPVHLQGLGSVDAVRIEKLSIFEGIEAGGTLVVPEGMDTSSVASHVSLFTFGGSSDADVKFKPLDKRWHHIELKCAGQSIEVSVPGGGQHRAHTVAAVAACAVVGGFPLSCMQRLAGVELPAGRGREIRIKGMTIIDDSYNANPVSMGYAIKQLAARPGRRLALLGDMLELGVGEVQAHVELAQAASKLDVVWCVGKLAQHTFERLPSRVRRRCFANAGDALLDEICSVLQEGDSLLVKGSNRIFWSKGFVNRLIKQLGHDETK